MKQYLLMFMTALSVMFTTQADELPDLLRATADRLEKVDNLETQLSDALSRIQALEARPVAAPSPVEELRPASPYQFFLRDENGDGFVDAEWEAIIEKGQAVQAKVWIEKETYWSNKLGSPPADQIGWYGTSTMPTIQIVCTEGEYFFKDTARLPGRFQVTCPSRWGSMLRFFGDGSKVIKDTIPYGVATYAPIGIYVEPKTTVHTTNGTMIVNPFEQQIERVILVAMNGTLPVYLANNQDRFAIVDCNIQQHQGAQIGIKHGPILNQTDYPFPATQVPGGNVYLADPRFLDLQLEGPHNARRKQAAILVSGNNIIFSRINAYGWNHVIYAHGGQNRVVDSITAHWGKTADGRTWTTQDDIVLYLLSVRPGNTPDVVTGVAGGFKGWILPKRSVVPSAGGWHNAGELCL